MKTKRSLGILLTALILVGTAACADEDTKTPTGTNVPDAVSTTGTAEEAGPVYPYQTQDFDGYTFRFLNVIDEMWVAAGSHCSAKLDFEKESGEIIEDEVYKMMRKAEEDLNINFAEIAKADIFELVNDLNRVVMAGDDAYDAAYVCTTSYTNAVKSVYNLHDIASIHLEEAWWHPSYVESMTFGDSYLYGAIDFINRWTWENPGCVLFNKDMVLNLGMEVPYDAVRNGTWTYDMMYDMMKAAVNLNGASDFTPMQGGTAIYGQAANHDESTVMFMQGTGEYLVTKDADNVPVLVEDLSTYINVYDKMRVMCETPGFCVLINEPDFIGDDIFKEGRALFNWEVIGCALGYRNIDFEYGIAPMPKYDENQERYYSPVRQYGMVLTIPLTNPDPERTGTVLDYMSWIGMNNIQPVVWESLCYKGVRDEDSIDMMEIIYSTVTADIGFIWDITKETQKSVSLDAVNGVANVASTLERKTKTHQNKLNRLMKDLTE